MLNTKVLGILLFASALLAACGTNPTALPLPAASQTPVAATATTGSTPTPAVAPSSVPLMATPTRTVVPQPTSTPGQLVTPAEVSPAAQSCTDSVLFVDDVTIPDFSVMSPEQAFVKTWRLRNAGSCTWGNGYSLSFLSGELMAGSKGATLPAAQPGDTIDVSVKMIAPREPGGYTGNWQIMDPQGRAVSLLGSENDYFWVKLNVSGLAPASPAVPVSPVAAAPLPATGAAPVASPVSPSSSGCAFAQNSMFEESVLALINQERSSRGIPALQRNRQLDAAALVHSLDMSCNNFVEHYGTNGSTWFTRINQAGYSYRYASENIAAGNPAFGGSADWVVEIRWMNSQIHRENILNPQVTEIGLAYVFNPAAEWGGYTTVDFAQP